MKFFLGLCFLMLFASVNAQSSFFKNLEPGPHAVGFKTIAIIDSARSYGDGPRPVLMSYWYPATSNENNKVTFHDFLEIDALKTRQASIPEDIRARVKTEFLLRMAQRGADSLALEVLLQNTTTASWNTKRLSGQFPLILTMQGGGRPAYTQFVLNEYLASHGYSVASVADIRERPDRNQTTAEGNAIALAKDLSIIKSALNISQNIPVAAIGFSKAGEAILWNQSHEKSFGAMIFMDAQPGNEALSFLDTAKLRQVKTPILAFLSNHQSKMTYEEAMADSSGFEVLGGPTLKIRLMEANHGDLTSAAILGELVPRYNRWPSFGNSHLSHETLCRITLFFLDHHLKGQPYEERMETLRTTLPGQFMSMHKTIKP